MAGAFGQPAYLRTSARQYETLERPHTLRCLNPQYECHRCGHRGPTSAFELPGLSKVVCPSCGAGDYA